MAELNENDLKKLYYSIGEVAKLFNVNTSLIRFWEKEFEFNIAKKNKKGNRLFTLKDIQNFNKIYHLVKERGFTLDGAKKALASNTNPEPESQLTKDQLISSLEEIRQKLLELKSK